MDPIKNIKLRWLHGALHDITYELSRSQFSRFAPHAWEPAINAYRCETCIQICVDLAGVDRSLIDLTVEPRRLVIRGTRELPEPSGDEGCAQQLLAMEIDYGLFERGITVDFAAGKKGFMSTEKLDALQSGMDSKPTAQGTIALGVDESRTPRIPEE